LREQHYTAASASAVSSLSLSLAGIDWNRQAIGQAIKQAAAEHKLKMPQVAMPLRVMVTGEAQTPSIDSVIELIGRERVIERIDRELERYPRG
jgi:glutamyl-tRNA synthetase